MTIAVTGAESEKSEKGETMRDRLIALINKAEVRMTPEEIEEQRISFAYGNSNYEDRRVTREEVVRASHSLGCVSTTEVR